jgi:hypothetical protein
VQVAQVDALQAHVDGLAVGVLAVRRHAGTPGMQGRVGLRRAVARDDLERLPGLELRRDGVQGVEQARFHHVLFAGAPVAQNAHGFGQRLGHVAAALEIDLVEGVAGVQVVQQRAPRPGRPRHPRPAQRWRGHAGQKRPTAEAQRLAAPHDRLRLHLTPTGKFGAKDAA